MFGYNNVISISFNRQAEFAENIWNLTQIVPIDVFDSQRTLGHGSQTNPTAYFYHIG